MKLLPSLLLRPRLNLPRHANRQYRCRDHQQASNDGQNGTAFLAGPVGQSERREEPHGAKQPICQGLRGPRPAAIATDMTVGRSTMSS